MILYDSLDQELSIKYSKILLKSKMNDQQSKSKK
jgi:hypothetical protein